MTAGYTYFYSDITCYVDMMPYDENGAYFLTAKGKVFCAQPVLWLDTAPGGEEYARVHGRIL